VGANSQDSYNGPKSRNTARMERLLSDLSRRFKDLAANGVSKRETAPHRRCTAFSVQSHAEGADLAYRTSEVIVFLTQEIPKP
jgi:hypothetical protein